MHFENIIQIYFRKSFFTDSIVIPLKLLTPNVLKSSSTGVMLKQEARCVLG